MLESKFDIRDLEKCWNQNLISGTWNNAEIKINLEEAGTTDN